MQSNSMLYFMYEVYNTDSRINLFSFLNIHFDSGGVPLNLNVCLNINQHDLWRKVHWLEAAVRET